VTTQNRSPGTFTTGHAAKVSESVVSMGLGGDMGDTAYVRTSGQEEQT
jgi:hypothetical protein